MTAAVFAPFQTVAAQLLPHALEPSEDGAHDLSHLQRVWHNVRLLHRHEGGDLLILLAATLLHDCVAVEKNSPLRAQASRLAADKASTLLSTLNWPNEKSAPLPMPSRLTVFRPISQQSHSKPKFSRTPTA